MSEAKAADTPPVAPSPPPAEKSRFPTWLKVLLGCGVGCGLLIVAAVLAMSFGAWWLTSAGKQIETGDIAVADTTNVVRIDAEDADGDLVNFLTTMFFDMQTAQSEVAREELPDSMAWVESFRQMQESQGVQGLSMYVPKEVTVIFEPGGDGSMHAVAAINLRAFPKMIRMFVGMAASSGDTAIREETHRDVEYRVFDEEAALAFLGGTMLWATSEEAMLVVIERVSGEGRESEPAEPSTLLVAEPGAWEVQGRFDAHGIRHLRSLRESEGAEPMIEDVERVALQFGIDVTSPDSLNGFVAGAGGDPDKVEAGLTEMFEGMVEDCSEVGMECSYEVRREPDRVVVRFEHSGIREALRRSIRESMTNEIEGGG